MSTAVLVACIYSRVGASASHQHVLAAGHATAHTLPSAESAIAGGVAKSESSCVPGVSAAYPPGQHHVSIDVDGTTRHFLLKVPFNVNASDGLPALVSLHGRAANPW